MNAGVTTRRVLAALRQRLISPVYPPGTRLDPVWLAEALATSTTPVRDALHLLVGEELIVFADHGGFEMAEIDVPGLLDLYVWNSEVLHLALRQSDPQASTFEPLADTAHLADRTAYLFQTIANGSPNVEHGRTIRRINARLHSARLVEAELISGGEEELQAITSAFGSGALASVRKHLAHYLRRRRSLAAITIRHLHRKAG